MAYEYQVFYYISPDPNIPTGMITDDDLVKWLNYLGKQDWRLVELVDYFGGTARGLFERKIEMSQALRDAQLGIKPETDKENQTDDGEQPTNED